MERGHRRVVSLLAVLLSPLSLVAAVPHGASASAQLRGGDRDRAVATVSGRCWGGPGVLAVSVRRVSDDDGTYRIKVKAQRLSDGSRWKIGIRAFDEQARTLYRRAVDGGWFVSAKVPASSAPFFFVRARELADQGYGCRLGPGPWRHTAFATCRPRLYVISAVRQLQGGAVAVPLGVFSDRKRLRWHIRVTATAPGIRQSVVFDDLPDSEGVLRSRVEFRSIENPRVHVSLTRADSLQCTLGYNPTDFGPRVDGPGELVPLLPPSLRPTH